MEKIKTEPAGPTEKVLTLRRYVLTICWRRRGMLSLINYQLEK
jgi:hypothetical protein